MPEGRTEGPCGCAGGGQARTCRDFAWTGEAVLMDYLPCLAVGRCGLRGGDLRGGITIPCKHGWGQ